MTIAILKKIYFVNKCKKTEAKCQKFLIFSNLVPKTMIIEGREILTMAPFEIKDANILTKILFLNQYLEKIDTKDKEKGEGISKDKINEDELVEISSEFEESYDTEELEEAVNKLHTSMDLDENKELSNEELLKFKGILDEIGLTSGELLELYNKYEKEVSEDVDMIETKELQDVDLDKFKEMISKYPKLQEVIEEIGYDKFFDLIDSNNDGKLSEDEIGTVSGSDDNVDNLSYQDIEKLIEENDLETTDNKEKVDEDIEFTQLVDKLKDALGFNNEEQPLQQAQTTPSYAPSGGYSTGGSSGGYSSGGTSSGGVSSGGSTSGVTGLGAKEDLDASIQELEQQKATKESDLETLNGELSSVYEGSDESVKEAKDAMDEAEEEYKELLADEAESNEEVKAAKDELENKEKEIEENEEDIKEADLKLTETQEQITTKEDEISSLKSDKSALESSLASVKSTKVTKNNEDEINSKIAELEEKIAAKDNEIQTAEDELADLKEDEKEAQEALDDAKELNETLKGERDDIEEKIKGLVSDKTKEALEKYQDLRSEYETAKETAITDKKTEITAVQDEITTLETKISELEAQKIQEENQISPWGQYDEERGQALADAANSLYGGVTQGGGWCATGVSQAIQKAFGYSTSGNGCDYGNVLAQRDDWVEITDSVQTLEDFQNLPAGAIVSWSPYNTTSLGNTYGHVYIADGQGHGISDFKENITSYYMDRDSEWRVFLPT